MDSGANRHMVNARHLFFTMRPYTGPTPYVTLGDGSTQCPIKGVISIDMVIPLGCKIRLNDVVYVPNPQRLPIQH